MSELNFLLNDCRDIHDKAKFFFDILNDEIHKFTCKLFPLKPAYFEITSCDNIVQGAVLKKNGSWEICIKDGEQYRRLLDSSIVDRIEWYCFHQETIAKAVLESNKQVLETLQQVCKKGKPPCTK